MDIWKRLNQTFASSSETRILHLHFQLQCMKKENILMSQYITNICILRVTGEQIKDSQLIMIALGSLGPVYEVFVTTVLTRLDYSMSFVVLQQLPMDYEIKMPKSILVISAPAPNTASDVANLATKSSTKTSSTGIICQICNKKGHPAINYYN